MTVAAAGARAQFSIEREYAATLEEAWVLWTTEAGIESWWGPEGFAVTVTSLDLRPGGELVYVMTAVGAEQVAFMTKSGMPLATECTVTYGEVSSPNRLVYRTSVDFAPGVAPYDVSTVVELRATAKGVRIVITFDAMHDDVWTERARAGHESQMGKLDALMAGAAEGVARLSRQPPMTKGVPAMFEKVAFTMYPVHDMARAERFYRETLGLGASTGSVKHGWVEFDLPGGGCLALTTHSGSEPSAGAGATIALEVADLDRLVEELKAKDVTLPATDIQSPVCRMAICLDSEGNKILLHQLKRKGATVRLQGAPAD